MAAASTGLTVTVAVQVVARTLRQRFVHDDVLGGPAFDDVAAEVVRLTREADCLDVVRRRSADMEARLVKVRALLDGLADRVAGPDSDLGRVQAALRSVLDDAVRPVAYCLWCGALTEHEDLEHRQRALALHTLTCARRPEAALFALLLNLEDAVRGFVRQESESCTTTEHEPTARAYLAMVEALGAGPAEALARCGWRGQLADVLRQVRSCPSCSVPLAVLCREHKGALWLAVGNMPEADAALPGSP